MATAKAKQWIGAWSLTGRNECMAIGVAALPRGGAVEIELTAAIKSEG